MKENKLIKRFKSLSIADYIVIIFMTLIALFALYMCIGLTIKMSQGFTLFGDSNAYDNTLETVGPTSSDIAVLVLYWVLTGIVFFIDIYLIFFKKIEDKQIVKKDIIDGKTVIVKEDEDK